MPTLQLTDEQVVELVRQLPPEHKKAALFALAAENAARQDDRLDAVEAGLRGAATDRGRDWDSMTEEQRGAFVDELIHEDRRCGS
jgi:hypothetical protein